MNMKGGTSIPFTAEIVYLGYCNRNNFVFQKWCSAQNSAKRVLVSMVMMETWLAAYISSQLWYKYEYFA